MLWFKAFHIIALVAWFSGLFYLPRLFVYHSQVSDDISKKRFIIMERRLYYYITTPAAIITYIFGIALLWQYAWQIYKLSGWLHAKLFLVFLLTLYHIHCGFIVKNFMMKKNCYTTNFYRIYNEIPTFFLITIVILVVVKPF